MNKNAKPSILHLCDPVNPEVPILLYQAHHPKTDTRFAMRTFDVTSDIHWLLEWIGPLGREQMPDLGEARKTIVNSYRKQAALSNMQALVMTVNGEPLLQLNVSMETHPFRALTREVANYVLFPIVNANHDPMEALEALQEAAMGCFAYPEVKRLFIQLDKQHGQLKELIRAAGFLPIAFKGATSSAISYYVLKKR